MAKERLDKLVFDRGLAPSRQRARALILAGRVLVDDAPVTKPGTAVAADAPLRLRGEERRFVSRGGLKLDGALADLGVDVRGLVVLDVGASTGGFTDCALARGARRVFAVDVGTNQLDWSLRSDPRVTSLERTNARELVPAALPGPADLAVIDVSFISITKLLGAVIGCLAPAAQVVAMVKPQFEVGREHVGKGGVVRDDALRTRAADRVAAAAADLGWIERGRVDSRVSGPKGNREIFLHLTPREGAS